MVCLGKARMIYLVEPYPTDCSKIYDMTQDFVPISVLLSAAGKKHDIHELHALCVRASWSGRTLCHECDLVDHNFICK